MFGGGGGGGGRKKKARAYGAAEDTEVEALTPRTKNQSHSRTAGAPSSRPKGILKQPRFESSYEEMLRRTAVVGQEEEEGEEEEEDDDNDVTQVRGDRSTLDLTGTFQNTVKGDEEMRLVWNASDLQRLSIITSVLAVVSTAVLPIVDYFIWYQYDARMTQVTITYCLIGTLIGALGIYSVYKKKPMLVSLHVILGYMLGTCLGVFAVSVYYDMESRCEVMQAASIGCAGCKCSWTNQCTVADLLELPECRTCQAWPVEICRTIIIGFGNGMSLTSVLGVLALFFTSVPVTTNLIMLIRMDNNQGEAFKSKVGLDVAELEHQVELILQGNDPTTPLPDLEILIQRVEERGMHTMADKATAAISVYNSHRKGPPITLKTMAKMATGPAAALAALRKEKDRRLLADFDTFDVADEAEELVPEPLAHSRQSAAANAYEVSMDSRGKRPMSAALGNRNNTGNTEMSRFTNAAEDDYNTHFDLGS